MNTILYLLSFLLCGIMTSQAQLIDAEHKKKAEKIIQKLSHQKQLSPEIKYLWSTKDEKGTGETLSFRYWTKRMAKEMRVDSIIIAIDINVGKRRVDFLENHYYKVELFPAAVIHLNKAN
jgi:hypothetical protein